MSDWKKALMVATKDGFLGPFFLDLEDVLELLPFAADVDDALPFSQNMNQNDGNANATQTWTCGQGGC